MSMISNIFEEERRLMVEAAHFIQELTINETSIKRRKANKIINEMADTGAIIIQKRGGRKRGFNITTPN